MVVVSGIGIVSPLGVGTQNTWKNLIDGRSSIIPTENGLEARVVDFSPNGARSRMGDFALLVAQEALNQAGLIEKKSRENISIGCAVSQSKPIFSSAYQPFNHQGLDSTLLLASFFGYSAESLLRNHFDLNGPASNMVAACATGIYSMKLGQMWIEHGYCDAVLVGAAESSLHPLYRAGFEQLGVLAQGDSATAARPFDKDRSGFVMGEGAAVMVLEKEDAVLKRGKKPLATVKKVSLKQSVADLIRFDPEGTSVSKLIQDALQNQKCPDYINAHGTGTHYNDMVELIGLEKALGDKLPSVLISSTKASTGHLLGAAGALEAALCVMALQSQIAPPSLHLDSPDTKAPFNFVSPKAMPAKIDSVLSLSYGFGGQMGAVLFGRI